MRKFGTSGLKIITAPTSEQLTLEECRLELRLDDDGDSPPSHPLDDLIADKIVAAREYCEECLQRALAPQTLELALDRFADRCTGRTEIELPMPPLVSITSVKYIDGDGDEQTLSDTLYALDNYQEPGWLLPAYGTSWPATKAVINAVKIRYVAGYAPRGDSPPSGNELPGKYRQAMIIGMRSMVLNGAIDADAQRAIDSLLARGRVGLGV